MKSAAFVSPPESKARIERLLHDLGSRDRFTRTYAEETLLRLGVSALAPVSRLARSSSAPPFARARAQRIEKELHTKHRILGRTALAAEQADRFATLSLNLRRPRVRVLYVREDEDGEFTLSIENFPHWEGDSGVVYVYSPAGKLIKRVPVVGVEEPNELKIAADKLTGVYRVEIHSGDLASWNVGTSTGRLAIDVSEFISVSRNHDGRYYFTVPAGTRSFAVTIEALDVGDYAAAVLTQDGKAAASTVFRGTRYCGRGYGPGATQATLTVRPPALEKDETWSLVVENVDDVNIRLHGVPPRLAMHPKGLFDVPESLAGPAPLRWRKRRQ